MKKITESIQNEQEQQENRLRLNIVIDRLIKHVSFPLSLLVYMYNKYDDLCALLYIRTMYTT